MSTAYAIGVVNSRALQDCCRELAIPYDQGHAALHDARAAGRLLSFALAQAGTSLRYPRLTPQWPKPDPPGSVTLRGERRPLPERSTLAALAAQLGVPDGVSTPNDIALAYLALLDRVLEDRLITEDEVEVLADFANAWAVDREDADLLHKSYLQALDERAWADGVLTAAEERDLETVAELLGVPLERRTSIPQVEGGPSTAAQNVISGQGPQTELAGKVVCFTGESVCSLHGVPLTREDQQSLATWAGLVVKTGVSRKLDILVMADPDSQSGKARKAAELGIRRVAEPVFWRMANVPID
jgi:DNA polymerase-3 subunit epsilon